MRFQRKCPSATRFTSIQSIPPFLTIQPGADKRSSGQMDLCAVSPDWDPAPSSASLLLIDP